MKQLFFLFLLAALLVGCSGKSTTDATQTVVANKTTTLAIEGMTCNGCENTIQEAVGKLAGVVSVNASHLDSTAIISYDTTQISVSKIGEAITEAGYEYKGEKLALPK